MADEDKSGLEELKTRLYETAEKVDRAWPILKPMVALRENRIILLGIVALIGYINQGVLLDWVKLLLGVAL